MRVGISKIKWYYKKEDEEEYNEIIDIVEEIEKNQEINKTHNFSDLENKTKYNIYAEIYDNVNNFSTTENIEVTTLDKSHIVNIENKTNGKAEVHIENETHNENFSINATEGNLNIKCDIACNVFITTDNDQTY